MQYKILRSDIINVMINAVKQSERIIFNYFYNFDQELNINKKAFGECVTDLDLEVEKCIIHVLNQARPNYGFFTEELYSTEDNLLPEYRWIIDPIDGTFNFIRRNPNFGVSIALERAVINSNREIIASVILLPMLNQLYWAQKGCGAFCISAENERKVYFSNKLIYEDLILASGESFTKHKQIIMDLINNKNLQIRITGSAAIDFAFTASGKFDILTQDSLKPWDIASGILLCCEAGGHVINAEGNDANIYDSNIIVVNNELLNLLRSKL